MLGRKLTLCGTRDDVKAALETIDVYAEEVEIVDYH